MFDQGAWNLASWLSTGTTERSISTGPTEAAVVRRGGRGLVLKPLHLVDEHPALAKGQVQFLQIFQQRASLECVDRDLNGVTLALEGGDAVLEATGLEELSHARRLFAHCRSEGVS